MTINYYIEKKANEGEGYKWNEGFYTYGLELLLWV